MPTKKEETASFVLRFTQKIFQNEENESQVQWRGNIRHVQGGDEKRFSEFKEVVDFIQGKLADLTILAMEEKSPEEQKGILSKSFELWKKMASEYPKMVMDTIKDPKAGVEQIQDQVSQQMHQVGDMINAKLDPDTWRPASKSDFQTVMSSLEQMAVQIENLTQKVDSLSKKKK
jgi:hypothetical protein